MCFVAAHADASETIDGMTLRRQAKKTGVNSIIGGPAVSRRIGQAMGGLYAEDVAFFVDGVGNGVDVRR